MKVGQILNQLILYEYRLPKWFTDKWLPALESGEYEQAHEALRRVMSNNEDLDDDVIGYCCLGLAGLVCDIPNNELNGDYLLVTNTIGYKVPEELLYDKSLHTINSEDQLAVQLVRLNDAKGFTFKQIAEWVRENCEIYEDGETI
jgi:hypothetical protein